MIANVYHVFTTVSPAQRMDYIANAHRFINNYEVISVINAIDANDNTGISINQACNKLNAYTGDSNLLGQILDWLKNGYTGHNRV
jgi:hypothetical protein